MLTVCEGDIVMGNVALISVLCPDRPGLVAAITGCLFDLGGNLGDTTFAVLGAGAEFSAVCGLPDSVALDAVDAALGGLPELEGAEVTVRRFDMSPAHGPSGEVTHQIVVSGGDQPGLVARLCEAFQEFGGNIVSLNAGRISGERPDTYVIRLAVWLPTDSADACLATVSNTAQHLQLTCRWNAV